MAAGRQPCAYCQRCRAAGHGGDVGLLGFRSERRWLRYASAHLTALFPRQLGQSGYNKRLRKMIFLLMTVIRKLGMDTSLWADDVRVVDSTPVQCGCSRETVTRSDLAGWAEYGYCASHSRYFWGLRLHLVCTLHGLPVMFTVAGAKADEREVLLDMLENDAELVAERPGQTVIGDKNYFGRDFERLLADGDLSLVFERSAGPGGARGTYRQGRPRPGPGPRSRTDCRDLAQRQDRTGSKAATHRLRLLKVATPPGINHLKVR